MGSVVRFVSNLGWGAFWTVVFLGVAYMVLRFASQAGGTSFVGSAARTVANFASPSGIAG